MEHEKEMSKVNSDGQAQIVERAAQAKMQEYQAKTQGEMQVQQAKTQGKIQEIQAEAEAKAGLMEKEFEYNMTLKGIDVEALQHKTRFTEESKDKRIDRQSSHTSKIAEQKMNNLPSQNFDQPVGPSAPSFESSEDTMTGGIEMGELDPS